MLARERWINYSAVILRTGCVIVASLPTSDGTATGKAGGLVVLNKSETVVETFAGSINVLLSVFEMRHTWSSTDRGIVRHQRSRHSGGFR